MQMTMKEILEATCGKDFNNKSKALSVIGVKRYDTETGDELETVTDEINSLTAAVNIRFAFGVTWVDLEFTDSRDPQLKEFYDVLEHFLEETVNDSESTETIPFLTLAPLEYMGKYFINCIFPISWAIHSKEFGEAGNILRLIFLSDNISFMESDLNEDVLKSRMKEVIEEAEEDLGDVYKQAFDEEYNRLMREDDISDSDRFYADSEYNPYKTDEDESNDSEESENF